VSKQQQRIRSHLEGGLEQNTIKESSAIYNNNPCSQMSVCPGTSADVKLQTF
jgi:hypothetical protein